MANRRIARIENLRKQLHQSLRDWHRADSELPPLFSNLHIFQRLAIPSYFSRSQQRNRHYKELGSYISELGQDNQEYSELLFRRFVRNETVQKVAFTWHASTGQVNRVQREVIGALTDYLLDKENAARTECMERQAASLPSRNYSELFGRETITAKIARLLTSPTTPYMVALTGLGGCGKTAVADAVVRKIIAALLYQNVMWVRIETSKPSTSLEALLGKLAVHLLPDTTPVAQYGREIRRLLKQERYLIVIDNLEEEIEQLEWLQSLEEFCNPSKLLITSRRLPADLADIYLVNIPELSQAAAKRLLASQMRSLGLEKSLPRVDKTFDQIYRHTGGSPLALKLVAGLLHVWPLGLILKSIGEKPTRRTKRLFNDIYQSSLSSITPQTQQLLQSMLLIGEEGATTEQLEAISRLRQPDLLDSLQLLGSRSLLELRGTPAEVRYGIHRLTQSFLNARMSEGLPPNRQKFGRAVNANLRYWLGYLAKSGAMRSLGSDGGNLRRAIEFGLGYRPSLGKIG